LLSLLTAETWLNYYTVHSQELNRILEKVNDFANALQEVGQLIQPLKENIVARLANDSFCPGVNLSEATGVDFDSILNDTVTTLDSANNFTIPKENETLEALNAAQKTTNNVENTSDNITPTDWQSLIFVVPFSIFAFLYIVGVALAWRKKNLAWYTCILSWVVLPLFVVLIVICFLCSGAIAIGASANAGKKRQRVARGYRLVYIPIHQNDGRWSFLYLNATFFI
jgi:NADH:ubiquinone oxidoreductase subunit 3 (subunit A)